ncbi:MAG: GNAT family N-acetyltransferase [Erythrobacter sp.]
MSENWNRFLFAVLGAVLIFLFWKGFSSLAALDGEIGGVFEFLQNAFVFLLAAFIFIYYGAALIFVLLPTKPEEIDEAEPVTVPRLETQLFNLKEPQDGDIDALADILGDFEVSQFLTSVSHPYTAWDLSWFKEFIVPFQPIWAVTHKTDSQLIGAAMFVLNDDQADSSWAHLKFWFGPKELDPQQQVEVTKAVLKYGFEHLNLEFIKAYHFHDDETKGAVLEQLGCQKTEYTRRHSSARGHEIPSTEWWLERDRFNAAP